MYDLLVHQNRLLGKLMFICDTQGRQSLKLSLGYKAQLLQFKTSPDRYDATTEREFSTKRVVNGLSLELSYKFSNQYLEIKNEIRGGAVERIFYKVKIPAESPLFLIRLSGSMPLKNEASYQNPLIIDDGLDSDSLVISFSFPGINGKPWTDELMRDKRIARNEIPIPWDVRPLNFFILTTCDDHPRNDGVSIWIPETHRQTKIS